MRRVSALVAVLLMFGAAGSGSSASWAAAPVSAQATPASAADLCDAATVDQFADVRDSDYAAAYISCMRALGLSQGRNDGGYGPDRDLNRGQMASFLVRLWTDRLGRQCPADVRSPFTDTAGNTHQAKIDCLFGLEITQGTTPTTYGPRDPLKASQISRFLFRTYRKAGGTACDAGVGSELEQAVACLLSLRVVPDQAEATGATPVTRAQMAVYVIGLWHNLAGRGLPPHPPSKTQPASMVVEAPVIRAADVRMGIYPCCADLAYWQIPIELGWWDELNITITPNRPTHHYFTVSSETIPWLESGEGDVAQAWVPGVFRTLETFGQDIPPIHFADIYAPYAILVAPDSEAKTALEFMDGGMSFPEAARAAVEQLVGAVVHVPPHSTVLAQYANAFFAYLPQWGEAGVGILPALDSEGNPVIRRNRDGSPVLDGNGNTQPVRVSSNDWRYHATPALVDDPTIEQLSAVPGRMEFAMPYDPPTLVQMMREGWDPLISYTMMYEHDAASPQTAITSPTVGGTGLLARREWVKENKDLAYRIISVANRALAFLEDPATRYQGWEIVAGVINRKRGLSLEPEDIGVSWEGINPSFNWEDQEALWDVTLPSYHPETAFATQIERLKANRTLSATFDTEAELEELLLAQELYYDLKGMQDRSDELFALAAGISLSASQQDLVDRARVFYERYNFYDALRFLEAARIG